jgi:hypothetical protein
VKIYGSDISSAQFPPAEELPHNVVLIETDILHRSEKHVTEKYDFIHIRAMVLVLADHEWKRVLENLEQRLSEFSVFESRKALMRIQSLVVIFSMLTFLSYHGHLFTNLVL